MNILLISDIYPYYINQSRKEISYALHYFTKEWIKNNRVIVIRPFIVPKNIKNINLYPNKFILDKVEVHVLPLIKIPKTKIFIHKILTKKIKKILNIKKFVPNVILAHMNNSFLWASTLSNYYDSKFIIGIHNGDLKKINEKKYRKAFSNANFIACRSYSVKKHFLKYFPDQKDKIIIANSGIEKKYIENKAFFLNKINNLKKKKTFQIITVASLIKLKNIDLNIKALSKLKYYNWHYNIVGDGEELKNLKLLIEKYNLKNRISFLGYKKRAESIELMSKNDIFLMVSAPETFGLAYLEAMAKGNIIIGAKNWGIDGIIKNGINGFLVNHKKEEELVNILKNLFENKYDIEKILKNSINTISNFSQENMANNYLKNFKKYN